MYAAHSLNIQEGFYFPILLQFQYIMNNLNIELNARSVLFTHQLATIPATLSEHTAMVQHERAIYHALT